MNRIKPTYPSYRSGGDNQRTVQQPSIYMEPEVFVTADLHIHLTAGSHGVASPNMVAKSQLPSLKETTKHMAYTHESRILIV